MVLEGTGTEPGASVEEGAVSRWLLAASLLLWACSGSSATLKDLRFVTVGDTQRADLLLDAAVTHRVFMLQQPLRVVIDLDNTSAPRSPRMAVSVGAVSGVRSARQGSGLRVVIDLSRPVAVHTSLKGPGKGRYHHLLVELSPAGGKAAPAKLNLDLPRGDKPGGRKTVSSSAAATATRAGLTIHRRAAGTSGLAKKPPLSNKGKTVAAGAGTKPAKGDSAKLPQQQPRARDFVVAVDAGHGGKDPGAKGRRGTLEKQVVLAISKRLKRAIDSVPGLHAVLIRSGDRYVDLRGRMRRARKYGADMFVSVHADAFRKASASGASVFVLSRKGATSESARWLAKQENAPFLAGGVVLVDKDDDLRETILDMSQSASHETGFGVASEVLTRLGKVTKLHSGRVERAGFLVLKSPDIPSILVETGFLSNPAEERKLRDPKHQARIARAIRDGVLAWFSNHPPPGTLLAERKHTIRRGDTLSGIAHHYSVSLKQLRSINGIKGDHLSVGRVLRIPGVRSDG